MRESQVKGLSPKLGLERQRKSNVQRLNLRIARTKICGDLRVAIFYVVRYAKIV